MNRMVWLGYWMALGVAGAASTDEMLEAAYSEDVGAVERLLESGSDPNGANRHGVTALGLACRGGSEELVKLLLEAGADPKVKLAGGETTLMSAARAGSRSCCEMLVAKGVDVEARERRGQTALMWAAEAGHVEVVDFLLESGADPDVRVGAGFDAFLFAVRQGHAEVVRRFLEAGVDVNEVASPKNGGGRKLRSGAAPLLVAMENGHFELAKELLDAGADPNDQRSNFAPLHALSWVRKSVRGDGVDGIPPPRGSGKVTSLQFARMLVEAGADVDLRLKKGGGMAEKMNPRGATPFLMAANTCDLDYMKLLVELGADPTLTNADRSTALLLASGIGVNAPGEEAGTEADAIEVIEWLVENGADVNAVDRNGETSVHGAVYKAAPKLLALLDEKGADIEVWNTKNRYGRTPLTIARGYRRGNFRPIEEMMLAVEGLMRKYGVEVPAPREGER